MEKNILSNLDLPVNKTYKLDFQKIGYVEFPNFLKNSIFEEIQREIIRLKQFSRERKFFMPPYNTPRQLSTLGGSCIANLSPLLSALYHHGEVREFIQTIVGEKIRSCQHPQEWMVINFLKSTQSTHGWHLDDPPYALVLIAEMQGSGGLLEIIPTWFEFCQKRNINPRYNIGANVELARQENLVYSKHLESGTAYILHASHCLHRVSELKTENSCRIALNMAFERSSSQISYGNTANLLYG